METSKSLIQSFAVYFAISLFFMGLVVIDFSLIKSRVVHYAEVHGGISRADIQLTKPPTSTSSVLKSRNSVSRQSSAGTKAVVIANSDPAPHVKPVGSLVHEVPATGPSLFDTTFTGLLIAAAIYLLLFLIRQSSDISWKKL